MSAYDTLHAAMAATKMDQVIVMRIDLEELLAEVNALRGSALKPASKYTAEFEEAWTMYPSRPGNAKAAAFKAWNARLKQGATALEMIEGTRKYAVYCKAERKEGEFIKQAATFYGPGEHFTADWTPRRALAAGTAGAGLPRGPAPETDEDRAARRSRWGLPGDEGAVDAPY